MITIYCNGKVHYRREDYRDPVVQETYRLMMYQEQVLGKSAYSIDWGDGHIEPSEAICPCGKPFMMFRIDFEGFNLCPECYAEFRQEITGKPYKPYLAFAAMIAAEQSAAIDAGDRR